jgi:hypothetical protein
MRLAYSETDRATLTRPRRAKMAEALGRSRQSQCPGTTGVAFGRSRPLKWTDPDSDSVQAGAREHVRRAAAEASNSVLQATRVEQRA